MRIWKLLHIYMIYQARNNLGKYIVDIATLTANNDIANSGAPH